eukprot:4309391-Lingulodinium_polyedra.AAC.1
MPQCFQMRNSAFSTAEVRSWPHASIRSVRGMVTTQTSTGSQQLTVCEQDSRCSRHCLRGRPQARVGGGMRDRCKASPHAVLKRHVFPAAWAGSMGRQHGHACICDSDLVECISKPA